MDAEPVGRRLANALDALVHAGSCAPLDAIGELLDLGEPAAAPLMALLEDIEPDEDDWTPLWATVALGELKAPAAAPALLRLFELPEGDVLAEAAVEALAKIGRPALPALLEFARGARGWEARLYAYGAIGQIPSPEALAFLVGALDRDPLLWSSIASALSDLGDPGAVPALRALLGRCEDREATQVREAIDILEGRHPAYPKLWTQDWRERYGWVAQPQ